MESVFAFPPLCKVKIGQQKGIRKNNQRVLMSIGNIFDSIPKQLDNEVFDLLIQNNKLKIERIISKGHISPESGWYDQDQDEWVIVIKGEALIAFENSEDIGLIEGGYVNIPAHTKHKVKWTNPDSETIWLAVHY